MTDYGNPDVDPSPADHLSGPEATALPDDSDYRVAVRNVIETALAATPKEARTVEAKAAHTGIVDPFAGRNTVLASTRPRPTVDYGTNANPSPQAMLELAIAVAQPLVDAGDASWCPVCGGTGSITYPKLGGRAGTFVNVRRTCARCRGGRLNPFHGCTFTTDDPCACVTRCQAYRPQETPTP